MSTRWTKNSAVQQPPPVCRKPPGLLPEPTPPFNTQTMQCFAYMEYLPLTPIFYVNGIFQLFPEPPDTTWEHGTYYPLDNIAVEIFSPPPYKLFTVTIAGFRSVALVQAHTWSNVKPQTVLPFSLPFLEHIQTSPPATFKAKITA